jgi:hypothetical protein
MDFLAHNTFPAALYFARNTVELPALVRLKVPNVTSELVNWPVINTLPLASVATEIPSSSPGPLALLAHGKVWAERFKRLKKKKKRGRDNFFENIILKDFQ